MKAIATPQTAVQPTQRQFNPTQHKGKLVAQWFRVDGKLVCKWFAI
ncbi:hypothetical protein H6G17_01205 [Chroococcidiopsis sp. FACHB-1243]|nr:hypothetical protein [Chroococcidiopsis sp. [FACHB-1243]]MBD2304139.1 hypothetical protein [Chroococcidiopsis sp. [FACHB-1243]]